MRSIILFSLIISLTKSYCQDVQGEKNRIRNNYQDTLLKVINALKQNRTPRINLIVYCMPETANESLLFYSLDQRLDDSKAFHMLEKKIQDLVEKGNIPAFKKYLLMSQFVDGYFAEAYFDQMESIIKTHKELFCKTIKPIPNEKTNRLSGYKAQAGCN